MFELFTARAVTDVLAFIVISPYCIQINSSEGEGMSVCAYLCVCVCTRMPVCEDVRWVGICWCGGSCLTDNLPIHMNKFEQ